MFDFIARVHVIVKFGSAFALLGWAALFFVAEKYSYAWPAVAMSAGILYCEALNVIAKRIES
jgi:hypothetical protein